MVLDRGFDGPRSFSRFGGLTDRNDLWSNRGMENTNATGEQIRDLANAIAAEAEAIRDGRTVVPAAMAALLLDNAHTLAVWLKAPGVTL